MHIMVCSLSIQIASNTAKHKGQSVLAPPARGGIRLYAGAEAPFPSRPSVRLGHPVTILSVEHGGPVATDPKVSFSEACKYSGLKSLNEYRNIILGRDSRPLTGK